MKRYRKLFERISSFHQLDHAVTDAARGKKDRDTVANFIMNRENEVIDLERELETKTYRPHPYKTFMIYDPKTRKICAADFRDRVVHHAVCAVLEPIFERQYIFDTYACRRRKGSHLAIKRAQQYCRRYRYYLKMDVCKFFDSIDHKILKLLIRRQIADPDLLWLLDTIIDHRVPWTHHQKGLPIGNLTSQHFANFYLSGLDHFIGEILKIEGYIRYMDDYLMFADEKDTLWNAKSRVEELLDTKLALKLKTSASILAPVLQGVPFLGFRIFPGVIRIKHEGWRRFRNKMLQRDRDWQSGEIDDDAWSRSAASLIGHLKQADTHNLRANFFHGQGRYKALTG